MSDLIVSLLEGIANAASSAKVVPSSSKPARTPRESAAAGTIESAPGPRAPRRTHATLPASQAATKPEAERDGETRVIDLTMAFAESRQLLTAIIIAEALAPPVALRDETPRRGV